MLKAKFLSMALCASLILSCGASSFATDIDDESLELNLEESEVIDLPSEETILDETKDTTTDDVAPAKKPIHEKTPEFDREIEKTASDWSMESLKLAAELGIIPEKLQEDFQATNTRAEFCALAVALYETVMGEEITTLMTFTDTDDINIQKMAGLGVVNGIGNDLFDPEGGLSREQAATILVRLATVMNHTIEFVPSDFTDLDLAADWAIDAIGQVQYAGIMNGIGDNKFMPQGLYSREQSIVTIVRLFNLVY